MSGLHKEAARAESSPSGQSGETEPTDLILVAQWSFPGGRRGEGGGGGMKSTVETLF